MALPFKITVCGVSELYDHRAANVTHVLSIIDPESPSPDEFYDYGAHRRLELRFLDIVATEPRPYAPQISDIEALLAFGAGLEYEPDAHLLVHCHMGISRSTAAAALLLAQAAPQLPADDLFNHLLAMRAQTWPNLRIIELGDEILGRNGTLVAGVRNLYITQLERDANWAHAGRAREIRLAYS